jgi:hypothetical protein
MTPDDLLNELARWRDREDVPTELRRLLERLAEMHRARELDLDREDFDGDE